MSSSTDVSRIVFNQMSDTKYGTLTPTEGEFYCTPDYLDLPILTYQYTDHILNDIQWLRADTFSWQSGDVYKTVYDKLVSESNNIVKKHPNCDCRGVTCSDDGILSGFSTLNTCFFRSGFNPQSNPWEIVFKVYITDLSKDNWVMGGSNTAGQDCYGIAFGINSAGKLNTYLSSGTASWDIASNILGTSVLSINTWYYIKLVFNGTQYIGYTSSNGIDWVTEFTITSSVIVSQVDINRGIGCCFYDTTNTGYLSGSIDLNESYIKINGNFWWKGILSYESANGFNIVYPENIFWVEHLYEYGNGWFYILDTTNHRFKLPRNTHGEIISEWKNGDFWCRIWSDGWCEQGGTAYVVHNTTVTVPLHTSYRDTTYSVMITPYRYAEDKWGHGQTIPWKNINTFGIYVHNSNGDYNMGWVARGYTNISDLHNNQYKYLYFFVGNYSKSAIEQTAGINSEILNSKMDNDLSNLPNNIDYIVEQWADSNNWYRVYKSGWCEQGGYVYNNGDTSGVIYSITLMKAYRDPYYFINMWAGVGNSGWQYSGGVGYGTGGNNVNIRPNYNTNSSFTYYNATGVSGTPIWWETKGYIR